MADYVLAVDGGNTKTIALVARKDGTICGQGRSRCADIYGAGSPEAALREITAAVFEAYMTAHVRLKDIEVGVFSLAGADWSEDFDLLRSELLRREMAQRVEVYNDSIGALRAGSPDGTGLAVVLGTATAIGARSAAGRIWHNSFWQWDGTGATDLGSAAVRLVLRAELGIDPPTSLTQRLLDHYQAETVEAMLHDMTRRGAPRRGYAHLAPMLLEACEQGDPSARRVVEQCGQTVGDYALAAARIVGLEDNAFSLVLMGGVLRTHATTLMNTIVQRIHTTYSSAVAFRSPYEPIVGALFLALESVGVTVDDRIHRNVRATLPPAALFAT